MTAQASQPNIPKLRFPKFIEEWNNKPFSDLGNFKGGGTPNTNQQDYWDGDIPWISSSDIVENNINQINITRYINDKAVKESATKIIPENSILLVSRVGVGKFAVTTKQLCTSQDFANLTPSIDDVFYIAYWLLANKEKLINVSQGTSIKGFTTNDLKTLKINIPEKEEQKKIASFLGAVDDKIVGLQKKKDLLEAYKKGMMQRLFSQSLRFTDDNGTPFPDWEEKKLGDLANITTGSLDANAMVENGQYHFFTCAKEVYRIDTPAFDTEALLVSGNGANVGYIHYYKGQFNAYQRTYVLDKFDQNIHYIKHFLDRFLKKRIFSEVKDGNTPYIVKGTLADMLIQLPSLDEQKKIADFLSAIDHKIALVASELSHAKTFKKGLLQQMFV